MRSDFDVVVVGSGAGGSTAAWAFAMAGRRVLLIERGGWADETRDGLRNHRFCLYGHNTGPSLEGNPRTIVQPDGREALVNPIQPGYQNVAMAVGGGTTVYGAQAWRFHPLDFQMASTYGAPEGSSLADWPVGYDDLAPYYEEVEQALGVSGSPAATNMPPRDYPMPAFPDSPRTKVLRSALDRLGWAHQSVPLMINSVRYGGRPECHRRTFCVGFTCPTGARGDVTNTILPWAVESGNLELWAESRVTRLMTDSAGVVSGVSVLRDGAAVDVSARQVVVAAGAIETARLLLSSPTGREPDGIGNNADQVGRNLQGHYYPGAQGLFDEALWDGLGPGPSISTTQFNHGNPGIVGGGMLADDFHVLPAAFVRGHLKPGTPAYGPLLKEAARQAYRRSFCLTGPVQETPHPGCRVTLDARVRDSMGVPVARLSGTTHPETVRTAEFMRAKAQEWLREAGAKEVWSNPVGLWLSAGQHQAGTCRMGSDPARSVVDARGRIHGHDNVLVCDASVHVTNGGFNPFLTVMATALRTARLNL